MLMSQSIPRLCLQVFEGRSQTKPAARWRAVIKALGRLWNAGLLSISETSALIEIAGSGSGDGVSTGAVSSARRMTRSMAKQQQEQQQMPQPASTRPSAGVRASMGRHRSQQQRGRKLVQSQVSCYVRPLPYCMHRHHTGSCFYDCVLHEVQEDEQLKRLAHKLRHLQVLLGYKFKDLELFTTAVLQSGGKATGEHCRSHPSLYSAFRCNWVNGNA